MPNYDGSGSTAIFHRPSFRKYYYSIYVAKGYKFDKPRKRGKRNAKN